MDVQVRGPKAFLKVPPNWIDHSGISSNFFSVKYSP